MKILSKLFLSLAIIAFCSYTSYAEVQESEKQTSPVTVTMVELKPQFPGGEAAMYQWLAQNLRYPVEAAENGISGKVVVSFVIEKDGSISNPKVVRGKHPSLDKEALRLVKQMPAWTPGKMDGKIVRVTYMLPINFSL